MPNNQEIELTELQKVETPRARNEDIQAATDADIDGEVSIYTRPRPRPIVRASRRNPLNLLNGRFMLVLKWIFCLCVILLLISLMPRTYQNNIDNQLKTPTVVIWNEGLEDYKCPCIITGRNYASLIIDAVIVNADRPYSLLGLEKISHAENFLLVFAAKNPLIIAQNPLTQYSPYYFNFTMSYRLDSDIRLTEYYFSSLTLQTVIKFEQPDRNFMMNTEMKSTLRHRLEGKEFLAGYISFNDSYTTRSQIVYLENLQQHMNLTDIQNCAIVNDCSSYKFMLIFEPTSCPDFVNSHILEAMLNFVVPVVISPGNISQLVPPGSYIDGADFVSPERLAQFLIKVSAESHLYAQYFWWHSKYQLNQIREPYCSICAALKKPKRQRQPEEFSKWWTQYKCQVNNYYF
ncbi:alpha-(1,3)-fucosyltransferase C-like [Drosophila albomicans]|uniref:Fucosyltransferase n=1 Tax=Drosophila albomicans TaxID=7291 RepID=A0A6P8X8L2_DROAB|nr:alpha-(1,3)-fucosyltransferase C-like [Drosophila albomicans]